MWSWPDVVLLLATRCLYQGVNLTKGHADPKADQMQSWPDVVLLLATRCLYQGGMSEQRSTGPNIVPLLATKCIYWGYIWPKVRLTQRLTKCQADLMQYYSWDTRYLYQGVHLTKGQADPKPDQMSSWPDVVPFLATRCLYQGYVWPQCNWT